MIDNHLHRIPRGIGSSGAEAESFTTQPLEAKRAGCHFVTPLPPFHYVVEDRACKSSLDSKIRIRRKKLGKIY